MGAPLTFQSSITIPNGRFVRWASCVPGMRYSLGIDNSLGIQGKDFDAGVLLDCNRVQVATLHGHWGMDFVPLLEKVIDAYGGRTNVFIVGEAAPIGVPLLRALWDHGYTWMYRHREEKSPGRDVRDILGHIPQRMDITVQWLARDIAADLVTIKDEVLHSECCKFGFRPRSKTAADDEVTESAHMTWGAPPGEHDDLVRALALANYGVQELPRFTPPKVEAKPGTIGHLLGWHKTDEEEPQKSRWS